MERRKQSAQTQIVDNNTRNNLDLDDVKSRPRKIFLSFIWPPPLQLSLVQRSLAYVLPVRPTVFINPTELRIKQKDKVRKRER